MAPRACAIVVNHNGLGYVEEAVGSLLEQELGGLEVLVVDNASTDGSAEAVESRFGTRVRLLRASRNLGFGAGNNLGIRASQGEHLILLNSDAVAAPGFARELLAAAESGPRIGMVACKIFDYFRRERLDSVGHLLYPDGLNRGRGRLEPDRGQYDDCREALVPSGAAALYRRAMIEEIGCFDESFFLYGDDLELGLRGRVAGWDCALATRAIAYHRYSQTAGAYSTLKAFHVERNRVWVLLKLFPLRLVLLSPAYTAARLAWQGWGAATGRGAAHQLMRARSPWHLAWVTARAYASAARGLPRVLSERARLRRLRRLSPAEFRLLLERNRLSVRDLALKD